MNMKKRLLSLVLAISMALGVFTPALSFAAGENDFLAGLEESNEEYKYLMLSESELLQGLEIVDRPGQPRGAKNIPMMSSAHSDLKVLAEDRAYDLPGNAQRYNPDTIYDLDSIVPRIRLIGQAMFFIRRCSTELVYKTQEAHNKASAAVFHAILIALNPFRSNEDLENQILLLDSLFEELKTYPNLTADDFATIYIKKIMNKDVREARKYFNQYFEEDPIKEGVRGKEDFVRSTFINEVNQIARSYGGNVKVQTILDLNARLKSATTQALLAPEIKPAPRYLSKVIDKEIRDVQNMLNKVRPKLPREVQTEINNELNRARQARRDRNATYPSVVSAVYDLRDYVVKLRNTYPAIFEQALGLREGENIRFYDFPVVKTEIDPYRISKIIWLNSPSFDFTPEGFDDQNDVPIIVGFANGQVQLGNYEEYVKNRTALRSVEEVVVPDFQGDEEDEVIDIVEPEDSIVIEIGEEPEIEEPEIEIEEPVEEDDNQPETDEDYFDFN